MPEEVICDRCRAVFASLDLGQQLCSRLGRGEMPSEVRARILEKIGREP